MSVRYAKLPIWTILGLAALLILILTVVYPLTSLFLQSFRSQETGAFTLAGYQEFFATKEHVEAMLNSITLAFGTTFGALLIGVPMAFIVARFNFPMKPLIAVLPLATFVLPDIIVTESWIIVLGNNGVVTNFMWDQFGITMPGFYGWNGLFYVMILQNYGYIYLMVLSAFRGVDMHLEEAAQNLGSSSRRVYRTVTIPVLLPPILVSALIVFTLAIDNFGVPVIVAPRTPILSVTAYNTFVSEFGGGIMMQATMSVILVLLVALVLLIQKGIIEGKVYQMEASRTPPVHQLKGIGVRIISGILLIIILLSLLPVAIITIGAFTKSIGPVLHWGEFSLGNFNNLLTFAPEAMFNSFFLASVATLAGVIFGPIVSYLLIKKRSPLTHALDFISLLPLAVSGTVLGISLVHTYNSGPVILTGTWAIMAMAYFIRRVPYSIHTTSSSLYSIENSIEEASINLGVPPGKTFLKVILPLMRPAIISGAILMWVTTLSELSATIVLYTPGLTTMPIQIFQQIDSGYMGPASAYSLLLIFSIFLPLLIAIKIFKIDVFAAR